MNYFQGSGTGLHCPQGLGRQEQRPSRSRALALSQCVDAEPLKHTRQTGPGVVRGFCLCVLGGQALVLLASSPLNHHIMAHVQNFTDSLQFAPGGTVYVPWHWGDQQGRVTMEKKKGVWKNTSQPYKHGSHRLEARTHRTPCLSARANQWWNAKCLWPSGDMSTLFYLIHLFTWQLDCIHQMPKHWLCSGIQTLKVDFFPRESVWWGSQTHKNKTNKYLHGT